MSTAKCTYGQRAVPHETRHSSHNQRRAAIHGPSAIFAASIAKPKPNLSARLSVPPQLCVPLSHYRHPSTLVSTTIFDTTFIGKPEFLFVVQIRRVSVIFRPVGFVLSRIRPFMRIIAIWNTFTRSKAHKRPTVGLQTTPHLWLKIPTGSIYAADEGDITQKVTRRAA